MSTASTFIGSKLVIVTSKRSKELFSVHERMRWSLNGLAISNTYPSYEQMARDEVERYFRFIEYTCMEQCDKWHLNSILPLHQ